MGAVETDRILVMVAGVLLVVGLLGYVYVIHPWLFPAVAWRDDTTYVSVDPGRVRVKILNNQLTVTNIGEGVVSCGGEREAGVAYPAYDLRAGNALAFDPRAVRMITCATERGVYVVYHAEPGSGRQESRKE